MQKPTPCIVTHVYRKQYTQVYNTPMSIYYYLFSNNKSEDS